MIKKHLPEEKVRNMKVNPYIGLFVGVIAVSTSAIIVKLITAPAGETVTLTQITGGIIVIGGIMLYLIAESKKR